LSTHSDGLRDPAVARIHVSEARTKQSRQPGRPDLVHERFCLELMVRAIEDLYDEGAAAIRRPELEAVVAG
jgi:hypothetical protein